MEQHLEADPLLREAMEGLRLAPTGAPFKPGQGPDRHGRPGSYILIGSGLLLVLVGIWVIGNLDPEGPGSLAEGVEAPSGTVTTDRSPEQEAFITEVDRAVEVPESLQVGAEGSDLHERANMLAAPVEREPALDSLEPKAIRPALPDVRMKGPLKASLRGREVLYLHDLKVVAPGEIHPTGPALVIEDLGTAARYATREEGRTTTPERRTMAYLDFMDRALAKYANGQPKGALQDLHFLLEQYPDDVNALFYSGLACHDLGLYGRAKTYLWRAGHHPVDSFQEEALWYHARSVESEDGFGEAEPLYRSIVAGGGFYADRAHQRLVHQRSH